MVLKLLKGTKNGTTANDYFLLNHRRGFGVFQHDGCVCDANCGNGGDSVKAGQLPASHRYRLASLGGLMEENLRRALMISDANSASFGNVLSP
ncbi:hypothetical protein O9992_00395 [Vibrio lentus]|nr:hypothetical protein [Vibrio lentus]